MSASQYSNCNAASELALLPREHEQLAQNAIIAQVSPNIQAVLESAIEYLPRPRQWASTAPAPLAPAKTGRNGAVSRRPPASRLSGGSLFPLFLICPLFRGHYPETLMEAIQYFSNPLTCIEFFAGLRWEKGEAQCPRCGAKRVSFLSTRLMWKCLEYKKQFSIKVGTIFEDSPVGLNKWLCAMFLIANCKNGVSSYEIARDIDVTQKTAWFMLHRIRDAMRTGTFAKLAGEVEVDETFIGGKARNTHKAKREKKITGRGPEGKDIVFGMVERGGQVITGHVDTRKKKELQAIIREHIEAGSAIFSDELKSYEGLENEFQHQVIDHAVEYVNGNVHTNTMENFWSLLKRGLHGTYISVEPYHLFRYPDEQAFRYNKRHTTDSDRFVQLCSNAVGRRVTWNQLTGKDTTVS